MWKMTTKRFDTEQVIGFNDTTESVSIVPATGASYTVSYKEGDEFIDDEKGIQSVPSRVFVQSTVVKVSPSNGYVTLSGAGNFDLKKTNLLPPPVDYLIQGERLQVVAFGDSITEAGDNKRQGGSGNYSKTTLAWWGNALSISNQDFYVLDGRGVASDNTIKLLARMDDVLLTDADIVMIMIGTNDLIEDRTIEAITADMENILDQIINAGKKVIIQPTLHRRPDTSFEIAYNEKVDLLNASYRTIAAARSENVVVAADPTAYNQALVDNPALVTTDGIHPLAYGAFLIGTTCAPIITEKVLSTTPVNDINYIPEFIGNGGEVRNGATGEAPNLWKLDFANPADGVGGTVNPDGSLTVRTGTSTGGTENDSKVVIGTDVPAGDYIFSINLTINDITPLGEEFSILLRESDYSRSTQYRITRSLETPADSMSFQNAKFITGRISSSSGRLVVEIDGNSLPTEQVEYTLSKPELRKVG